MARKNDSALRQMQRQLAADHALTFPQLQKLHVSMTLSVPGYADAGSAWRIPYFGTTGSPIAFERYRFREPGEDLPKYMQVRSGVRCYFPPLVKWKPLLAGTKPLYITEGEFKAAAMCAAGLPTIGLGGVDSWQQKRVGITLIEDLTQFEWEDREVTIVFDSDLAGNRDVQAAMQKLGQRLADHGADPFGFYFQDLNGVKVGADDFLISHNKTELRETIAEQRFPVVPSASPEMKAFAEDFVYCKDSGTIFDLTHGIHQDEKHFKTTYANRLLVNPLTGREVALPAEWLKSPRRITVSQATIIADAAPRAVVSIGKKSYANAWQGYTVEPLKPRKKDIEPWTKLLRSLVPDATHRDWFERWLAFTVQHPGKKMLAVPFIYGPQGCGKTSVGELVIDVLGSAGTVVDGAELMSSFNGWLVNKVFAMGNDLKLDDSNHSRLAAASRIKYIADDLVRVNEKYQSSYDYRNVTNIYLNANRGTALPLDPSGSNRRFWVWEVEDNNVLPHDWFTKDFHNWRHGDGPRYLLHHLLRLDTKGLRTKADAPRTKVKDELSQFNQNAAEQWVSGIQDHVPIYLEIASAKDLYKIYARSSQQRPVNEHTFYQYLPHHLAKKTGRLGPNSQMRTYWVIRNVVHWSRATPSQVRKQLEKQKTEMASYTHQRGGV